MFEIVFLEQQKGARVGAPLRNIGTTASGCQELWLLQKAANMTLEVFGHSTQLAKTLQQLVDKQLLAVVHGSDRFGPIIAGQPVDLGDLVPKPRAVVHFRDNASKALDELILAKSRLVCKRRSDTGQSLDAVAGAPGFFAILPQHGDGDRFETRPPNLMDPACRQGAVFALLP